MKGKLFYTWIGALCLSLLASGCGDFLEVYSKDQVYAASTTDLDEVLIGNGYMSNTSDYYPFLYLLDDDVEELITSTNEQTFESDGYVITWRNMYTWQKDPFKRANANNTEISDGTISSLYAHIAYVNTIINYVDEFPNDPIEERMRVQGEGQFLRAAYYLQLSNLYGWAYDAKNGGKDLSVPLKLYEWVVEDKFARATVGEVYKAIETDLKNACVNLKGVVQKNFYRTNELAARTLLSRLYLYKENYDLAIAQCDSAFALGCSLSNLNYYDTETAEPNRDYLYAEDNPEIIFTMGGSALRDHFKVNGIGTYGITESADYTVSEGLLQEFRKYPGDLRVDCYLKRHYTALNHFGVVKNYPDVNGVEMRVGTNPPSRVVFENFVLRTVEVYLNKAEAQAMKGNLAGAVTTLQPFLETRYKRGQVPQIASLSEADLVKFIRSERRRELCFEGHRWPDLRRYAVNSKHPAPQTITHIIYNYSGVQTGGTFAGTYTLGTYGEDEGWILPFPVDEITFGDGILENPNRPERPKDGEEKENE